MLFSLLFYIANFLCDRLQGLLVVGVLHLQLWAVLAVSLVETNNSRLIYLAASSQRFVVATLCNVMCLVVELCEMDC